MQTVKTQIEARKFMSIVLENIAGEPSMVTDRMINSINRWINSGNQKECYNTSEIELLVDWVMTGR